LIFFFAAALATALTTTSLRLQLLQTGLLDRFEICVGHVGGQD